MTNGLALRLLAGLLALYLIAPFAAGLAHVGLADWRGVDLDALGRATIVSLTSATLATLAIALGGIPLGYLLARRAGRGMALLGFIVQLPLALPPLTSGILLLFLVGYASPLGMMTGGRLTDSFTGIVLAEAFVAAPFLIIAARSAFAGIDPMLEDVAATLGHGPAAVFRKVSLALAWRTLWAGLLLTWLRAFGEFGATVMLAYHPYSLPVYTYVAFGSQGLPAMLPILVPTLAAAILVMAVSQHATPNRRNPNRDKPLPPLSPDKTVPPRAEPSRRPLAFAFTRRLDGFVLDVAWRTEAKRLAILGASGSGKSATLRLIAGLDRAERHELFLQDRDLTHLAPHQRGIAYVPQNYGLYPNLTVAQQIAFARDADPCRARHWLQRLELVNLAHRIPAELSLGQQQRVALARALARPGQLLLLDEPFSALDASLRARLRDELLILQREIEATTILVTHDPAEAMMLADEILLLQDGHVLRSGAVEAVYARPGSEAAARLLGAENVAAAVAVAPNRIALGAGVELAVAGPSLAPGPVGWAVPAGSIRIGGPEAIEALVLGSSDIRAGRRNLTLRLGATVLQAAVEPSFAATAGACRISIDPASLQVWPARAA